MTFNIVFLLYTHFEELDFAGPYEVFGTAAMSIDRDWRVVTASLEPTVRAAHGLVVVTDCRPDDAPDADILVVPGGSVSAALKEERLVTYIRSAATKAQFVVSVCTGVFLLDAAGLLQGKCVTTHWAAKARLRERENLTVVDARWVHDGNIITAAGVSAGIDMALYLLGQLKTPEAARGVQLYMEYEPEPPYRDVADPVCG
jgi:transcriptional regulator GlxA family with amidase domain